MPAKPAHRMPEKTVFPVKDSGFSTPSLDRALAVLQCLGGRPRGLTLSEIATELGLSVNFVYRVTQSLVAHGYLCRDGEKRFTVGPALVELCQPVVDDVPLVEAALPAMHWLADETGESAHVGIISGHEGLVLERVLGRETIKLYVDRGTRYPLHTSAPGKVTLAFMPEAERDAIMKGMTFEKFQPWTISSRKELLKCLDDVRKQGWASDLGEHLMGFHCLAAPVRNSAGRAVAAIWITGPSQRLDEEQIDQLHPVVTQAGLRASQALSPSFRP